MATRKNEPERPDLGLDESSVSFAPDREGFGGSEPPRPDAAIHRDIVERLSQHPKLNPRDCEILVHNGEVRLAGVVHSGHARRLIEDLCFSVPGVWECDNDLRVSRDPTTGGREDPDRG